ncbi:MAG: OmpA family protein [Gemmatimonadaceae bacterium]|jgi:OmpA-OmpF porin, OOP family|nr:OmpA family protein [Gemmatimonadaceae bacterium]
MIMRPSLALLAVMFLAVPAASDAQSLGERLKQRAAERAKQRGEDALNRKTDEAVDKAIDGSVNVVKCVVTDTECISKARDEGRTVVRTDKAGKTIPADVAVEKNAAKKATEATDEAVAESSARPAARRPAAASAWANYDFVPGEKPLVVSDFSKDVVGDFPRSLEAVGGNWEIVEIDGERWMRGNGKPNEFAVKAAGPLPSRWTLEFELLGTDGECWVYPGGQAELPYLNFSARHDGGYVRQNGEITRVDAKDDEGVGQPYQARIMVDGIYVKSYIDAKRVVNVPNLTYTRSDRVHFWCDGTEEDPIFIRNVRLAGGGRKLYDALAESGRVATQGIYFDTGKDVIRPESTPTLKEIAAMLSEHTDLQLTIEGHTDNVGAASANLTLSQKRADAVRAALVSQYGIEGSRLTAVGRGQSAPAAPNTTAEGRQQNRRVELVKR